MIIFVTGATSGFGLAVARLFARNGARIIALGRRSERLAQLADEIGPDRLLPITIDIRDRDAIGQAIAGLPGRYREIDVLVNNAGLARGMTPAQAGSIDDWDQMIDTNIKGLLYCTRAILPGMIERKRGHVINLGSTAGEYPYPGGNVYGATKAFVHQLSNNLRADLLGTPVRVTNIEPGLAGGTEFSVVRLGDQSKADEVYAGAQALTPDDIADTIYWVATRPARVNINHLQLMPVCQAFGPLSVVRQK